MIRLTSPLKPAALMIQPARHSPGLSPKVAPTVSLSQLIGYNLLIVAAIFVLRVLFTIFRDR